ncbi:DUF4367 domain-containing protein [Ruminococcus sp. CLA-AA-H200]|uniref:DUF4367 domain-containing protein n=1 Tax=Ruminococcus turbiniformis TaxID=2881258 RepID=A0ABS8FZZ8_9FIRM|nr:DUF4367 domain-containing protein [Ruminococcus turbiniformis]MCC2255581.1 DUF4367 domain-containing protein [Ruminococcus turbiniformis]
MKELKKLSLKKEIDREAERIEEEIRDRDDLDDIKVSDDFETSLFNKIQEYEYDKRVKKVVRHRKKRRYVVFALAAVIVLVCGSVMTGVGSKSYWKVLWDKITGEENLSFIEVEKMDSQETVDIDELYLFRTIRNELGIVTVRFGYMPNDMHLMNYTIEKEHNRAVLYYEYNDQIIRYSMYMNNADSSFAQIDTDNFVSSYQIIIGDITVSIKNYDIDNMEQDRYVAEFEYMDAQYQIMGIIEKEEFDKIIENLIFLE